MELPCPNHYFAWTNLKPKKAVSCAKMQTVKITCIIVDDDSAYCRLIAAYAGSHEQLDVRGKFTEPGKAKEYLLKEAVDMIFLDMEMPELNGISLIRSLPAPPLVIFITSHPDYAIESYELNAIDYLLKPVSEERFIMAADKAIQRIEITNKLLEAEKSTENFESGDDYFVIRTDNKFVKIKYADILYVEAMADMIKIHTQTKNYVPLVNLKFLEQSLPPGNFIRTHRAFIVNSAYITSLDAYEVQLGAASVPLGQAYKDAVIERVVGKRLVRK